MTTTGSSLKEWHRAAKMSGLTAPTRAVCCYPINKGWIGAQSALIAEAIQGSPAGVQPRVLFSAHGLPKKVIARGDPYQWQIERTVAAVTENLQSMGVSGFSSMTCYQSRVGPLEWIDPSTEDALKQAAAENVPVIVVPIAFVSEHSETLVELDMEYRELATEWGVPAYHRVPAVGTHAGFIDGLAELVKTTIDGPEGGPAIVCGDAVRLCPANFTQCPNTAASGGNTHA